MKPSGCGIFIPLFILLLWGMFSVTSCIKDKYDFDKLTKTEWNPDLAIPIAYSKLTLHDLLRDYDSNEVVVEDVNTQMLTIIYNDTLYSIKAGSLISIPDQSYNTSYGVTPTDIATLLGADSVTIQYSSDYNFITPPDQDSPPQNPEINTVKIKKGTLNLTLSTTLQHSGYFKLTFPTVTSGSITLSANVPFSAMSTNNASIPLDGYTMDLTKGGTTFNTLPISYELKLYNSGNPILTSDSARLSMSFQNTVYSYMDGYLGKYLINMPKDSVDLNLEIFNDFAGGTIYFEDPKIAIHIENSYGLPVNAAFTTLDATSPQGNQSIILNGIFPGPGVSINYPSMSQVGQMLVTDYNFDKNTSNFQTVLGSNPKYIVYEVNGQLNPSGPPALNFITDSSYMSVAVQAELPLWGYAGIFTLMDTVNFQLEEVEDNVADPTDSSENLDFEWIKFRINVWNYFPMDVSMQVYFADSSSPTKFTILDSLNNPYQEIVNSGKLDANGKVIEATHRSAEFYVDHDRVKKVAGANKMIITGKLSTTGGATQSVKIYSNYYLLVKLGLRTKLKTKI